MRLPALALSAVLATPAAACDLALLLAVDVSGSVDPGEYRVQMQGLAEGLRDDVVAEALVRSEAMVALVQWTGSTRQRVSIPWTPIADFDDVEQLAQEVAATSRVWRNFSTAVGEALSYSRQQFAEAQHCRRKVIDISGDGVSNEGVEPRSKHARLRAEGITVNAIVIEGGEEDLTAYFWENVITGDGAFVVAAQGFDDYPERIRMKLRRETTLQLSGDAASHSGVVTRPDDVITKTGNPPVAPKNRARTGPASVTRAQNPL